MLSKFAVVLSIFSFVGVLILSYFHFFSGPKFVYVDANKITSEYQGMKNARLAFENKANVWRANIDTLTIELRRQIIYYDNNQSKFTAKEKQLSKQLIDSKRKQLDEYQNAVAAMAEQEETKLTSDAIARINAQIKKFGEDKGYTIVMAATEYGNIAYADETLDITEEVLAELNKSFVK